MQEPHIRKEYFLLYFIIMDFGEILDNWENRKTDKKQKMADYLDKYLPDESSKQEKERNQKNENPGKARAQRLKTPPQRTLDLHGMRIKEAIQAVDKFLSTCKKDGIKKVLIIHGKGNHSREPFILARKIKEHIQKSPLTGEWGIPDKHSGGSGAIWVLIRI
ncbi:MAG: Smr/MutS family protein [Spirochaetales bacterium]|nr:Smr/MutS family protein [Spirochaetales bacterium]